jgi:hypothetical protein
MKVQLNNQTQALLDSKVLDVLVKENEDHKKRLDNLENNKVVEALPLSDEDFKSLGILKHSHRLKTGKGWRPLLESEIKEAQEHSDSASGCAKYLGVSYICYKKWAKVYGLFKIKPSNKGTTYVWAPDKGKYPLNQILEGKFPEYPIYRLKDRVIRSGQKKAVCENCGFSEHRLTDNKMPLLIAFKDGNEKNHVLENIQVLCYNCMFLVGRGYIRRGKVEFNYFDPDRMQGSARKIESRF